MKKHKVLVDLYCSNKLSKEEFLSQLSQAYIQQLFSPHFNEHEDTRPLTHGKSLSIGVAVGTLTFRANNNTPQGSILAVQKLCNDQIIHFDKISGIIAQQEERSSHAAIVSRSMAKPLMSGLLSFELEENHLIINGQIFHEGDYISIDCFNNKIYAGNKAISVPEVDQDTEMLMKILATFSNLKINGNADIFEQAKVAVKHGAAGIEPRSEHMFFSQENLRTFRALILSKDIDLNSNLAKQIQEIQYKEFHSLFLTCSDKPLIIRLFDPPMHEFLPKTIEEIEYFADFLNIPIIELHHIIQNLAETNPMMGNRGARLLITKPELIKIQASSIFQAAMAAERGGEETKLWISIPMVIDVNEVKHIKKVIQQVYEEEVEARNKRIEFKIGVMIETPRAALLAHEIAPEIDFISFGTNDLTAQTFSFSRGDCYYKYLNYYLDKSILPFDPFYEIDKSVHELISIAVERVRKINPGIHIGLCGEQGSQEITIRLCHALGFNSISCNSSQIPSATYFAAKAALSINFNNKEYI